MLGIATRRAQFALQRLQKLKDDGVKRLGLFHIRHVMGSGNRDVLDPADLLFEFVGKAMECDLILLPDHQQGGERDFVEPSPSALEPSALRLPARS